MTIEICKTNNIKLIESILHDKKLSEVSLSDDELELLKLNKSIIDPQATYLAVYLDNENPIGIIKYEPFSTITVSYHGYLLPQYWGSGLSDLIQTEFEEYIKRNTIYHKIIIKTPLACREVLKAALRQKLTVEGIMSGAVYWRSKVETLVILSKFIKPETSSKFKIPEVL